MARVRVRGAVSNWAQRETRFSRKARKLVRRARCVFVHLPCDCAVVTRVSYTGADAARFRVCERAVSQQKCRPLLLERGERQELCDARGNFLAGLPSRYS